MYSNESYCSPNMPSASVCCCCLKEGSCRSLYSEHYYDGQKEIYEQMLKSTLNIAMSNVIEKCHEICDSCISQLRDAAKFKEMVVNNEKMYLQYYNQMQTLKGAQIKAEEIELDTKYYMNCDGADPSHEPISFDEDDEILANIKIESTKDGETEKDLTLKRKNNKVKNNSKSYEQKELARSKLVERRGNGPILRENSLKLLSNSTACAFQWNKSRYRCFCCDKPFSDLNSIKEHSNTHTIDDIKKKIIAQQNRLVKVEISILHCKLCDNRLENLATLKDHLTDKHRLTFDSQEDLLVPFKIEPQLQCQICKENFRVFRHLNIHMNKHYQKHVCHICGAGFSNLVFLNLHKTRTHKPYSCKLCNITFINKIEKKKHEMSTHGVKFEKKLRFPCPYCPERFYQESLRIKHLVSTHGMEKPEHKCKICSKDFLTLSLCNNHIKTVHMKQKNHECDICHNVFYTKSDVSRHKVTHTGEKNFSCGFCNNPFATKDSLRRHVKRTHVGGN